MAIGTSVRVLILFLCMTLWSGLLTAFNASGKVTDSKGRGVTGVTIGFAGIPSKTPAAVQTDLKGNWSQTGFEAVQFYVVVPSKAGCSFQPAQARLGATSASANFVMQTFTLSGRVKNVLNDGVPNVNIAFQPLGTPAVSTDASGNWTASFCSGTNVQIRPQQTSIASFFPVSLTASNETSGLDFLAFSTFSVQGKVLCTNGSGGLGNINLSFKRVSTGTNFPPDPANVLSDDTGNWSKDGFLTKVSYTVTPSKFGFSFTPSSLNFDGTRNDLNFNAASTGTYALRGKVTRSDGSAAAGIQIAFSGTPCPPPSIVTNSTGDWLQSGFGHPGSYVVTVPGQSTTPQQYTINEPRLEDVTFVIN